LIVGGISPGNAYYSKCLKINGSACNHNSNGVSVAKSAVKPDINNIIMFAGKKLKEAIERPLTLLYMADTHSNTENIPRLKTAIDGIKGNYDNTLTLHAGDFGLGNGNLSLQVDLLNDLGVQYATLGNHEFFVKSKHLAKALKKADFQVIVNNLDIEKNNPLKPLENNKLVKSTVKEINGVEYGLIGATTQDINGTSYQKFTKGIVAVEAKNEIRRDVEQLEKQGVNRIILVSHLGLELDKEIAQTIPGIDVIVGGHDHIKMNGIKKGVNLFESKRNNEPVLILHSGEYGENLGVSHLVFNKNGLLKINDNQPKVKSNIQTRLRNFVYSLGTIADRIININTTENQLINVSKLPKEKNMSAMLDKELTLIAQTKKDISCEWPVWEPNLLGTLTADAVKELTGAEIVLIQSGGLRQDIKKGPVFAEIIKNQVIPYDTNIVTVKLTGQQILDALNNGASSAGTIEKPGIMHVSGLRYSYDALSAPDERIKPENVTIETSAGDQKLDLNKTYIVGFDKFLLKGCEGFTSLKDAEVVKEYKGQSYPTALIEYIEHYSDNPERMYPDVSSRITVLNRPFGSLAENIMYLKKKLKSQIENTLINIENNHSQTRMSIKQRLSDLINAKNSLETDSKDKKYA
jgi:2',3'-cyclic-nucleotide 2'-phosphodiesterase (5'-nucleotidase family)